MWQSAWSEETGSWDEKKSGIPYHAVHPNVLPVYGFFQKDKYHMCVVQKLPSSTGLTLQDFITQDRKMDKMAIISGLVSGLAHIHRCNLWMFDEMGPKSIYINEAGTVVQLDSYNLSRCIDHYSARGGREYMGCRQCIGDVKRFQRMDVYPLGMIIYAILSGKNLPQVPPADGSYDPRIPTMELDEPLDIINRCCKMDPFERPQVSEVLAEINKIQQSGAWDTWTRSESPAPLPFRNTA